MVQNKDNNKLNKGKITNGDLKEETLEIPKLNGVHSETNDYSEDEDDYLEHLLIVPSLDKNVSNRNMTLISESLSNFYTTIENRKEYPRIKQELMGELNVPIKEKSVEKDVKIEEKDLQIVAEVKQESEIHIENEILPTEEELNEIEIEVSDVESVKIKNFSLCFTKARFVPEVPLPSLYDQYLICRRCTIFFKTHKFRKMHNAFNHRRKKIDVNKENLPGTSTDTTDKLAKPRQRIRNSIKGEPLVCDLCAKSFRAKTLIRSHMYSHTEDKPIQCTLCPYAGKRNHDLKKHIFTHHNPDRIKTKRIRRRKCDKCDEILENKQAFKLHMRLNHKEKVKRKPRIFKRCEKCQEPIYTKKGYKIHMKEKHVGFMYIKCERCNRRFKTNFRLKKHKLRYANANQDCKMKVNKNTGEFVCEHCNQTFSLKSYLSLHMRKHRVYECEQCQQTFKSQFSLKYHEFSHLDIEPKCSHCLKVFSSEQKFANHLKRKTCMSNGLTLTNGHAVENGNSA
ncbi:hypothetical protein PVAND_013748 [Polypedilum vanderplanki]|uniref:C2H2-type domain-containing protein n=1 Tax=Polypedilum vanderplanki TaxID=319348 RepID=A0A9J6CRN5_POLVA|nr:hypothetical protein PVAND_013748 [Polypedilum vanderplanki]